MELKNLTLRRKTFSLDEKSWERRKIVLAGLFIGQQFYRGGGEGKGFFVTIPTPARIKLADLSSVLGQINTMAGLKARLPDASIAKALVDRALETDSIGGPYVRSKYPDWSRFFIDFPEFAVSTGPGGEASATFTTCGIYAGKGGAKVRDPKDQVYVVLEIEDQQ